MTNPITLMKQSAAQFLRQAAATIMKSYEDYLTFDRPQSDDYDPFDPKTFKAFHDGGKSAASHLETVLKIGSAAEPEGNKNEDDAERIRIATEYDAVKAQIRLHKRNGKTF